MIVNQDIYYSDKEIQKILDVFKGERIDRLYKNGIEYIAIFTNGYVRRAYKKTYPDTYHEIETGDIYALNY